MSTRHPLIIGIDGPPGSGRTALADALVDCQTKRGGVAYRHRTQDYSRGDHYKYEALDDISLRLGIAASIKMCARAPPEKPRPLVVIEGCHLLHRRDVASLVHLLFYIVAPPDTIAARLTGRRCVAFCGYQWDEYKTAQLSWLATPDIPNECGASGPRTTTLRYYWIDNGPDTTIAQLAASTDTVVAAVLAATHGESPMNLPTPTPALPACLRTKADAVGILMRSPPAADAKRTKPKKRPASTPAPPNSTQPTRKKIKNST